MLKGLGRDPAWQFVVLLLLVGLERRGLDYRLVLHFCTVSCLGGTGAPASLLLYSLFLFGKMRSFLLDAIIRCVTGECHGLD